LTAKEANERLLQNLEEIVAHEETSA